MFSMNRGMGEPFSSVGGFGGGVENPRGRSIFTNPSSRGPRRLLAGGANRPPSMPTPNMPPNNPRPPGIGFNPSPGFGSRPTPPGFLPQPGNPTPYPGMPPNMSMLSSLLGQMRGFNVGPSSFGSFMGSLPQMTQIGGNVGRGLFR
jgi:hypothetical protein